MRVKYLAAAVGLSVTSVVALGTGVSMASRATSPQVEPTIEAPAEPVEEAPAVPVEETTTPPAVEEAPAPPVVEEPAEPVEEPAPAPVKAPKVEKPAAPVTEAPVVEEAPVTPLKVKDVPAPAPDKSQGPEKAKDPCHMDSYEPRQVDSLQGGEAARAQKVDRNDNGQVCRKDIPGKGKGNTGEGSNIKDDQAR